MRRGPLAYRHDDWGPALVSLWLLSWGHMEERLLELLRCSGGWRETQRSRKTHQTLERERGSLLQNDPGQVLPHPSFFTHNPQPHSPPSGLPCRPLTQGILNLVNYTDHLNDSAPPTCFMISLIFLFKLAHLNTLV